MREGAAGAEDGGVRELAKQLRDVEVLIPLGIQGREEGNVEMGLEGRVSGSG